MQPLASLIIHHWNTSTALSKLLTTLGNNSSLEIIVIDNNSEKSASTLPNKFPHIKLIQNKSNRGFATAYNQGTTIAHGDWLFFLNSNVLLTTDQIQNMINYAQENKLDALSPITEKNNHLKSLLTPAQLLLEFSPLKKIIQLDSPHKTLTSSALLIKKTVLKKLGGWDERFFMQFEDSDLSLRLYDNNYKVGWYPQTLPRTNGKSLKKLPKQHKKDIFFYAMNVYAQKHFSKWGQRLVKTIKWRYSGRKTLPILEDGVSLVVPNMRLSLLKSFLLDNWSIVEPVIKKGELELIIVSSALNPKNIWQFRAEFSGVRFILLEKNLGFATTVNLGWQSATKKWLGTINDDTIMSADWISESLSFVNNKVGSINPLIIGVDGKIESAGIRILPLGKALPTTHQPKAKYFSTDATNGAAVLYNHEALEKVGLFDERFGSYLEDIDLSLRLKKKGYYNTVCTTTEIIHKKHSTSRKMGRYKRWLDAKNWWLVILKNWPLKWWLRYLPQIILERGRNLWGVMK